MGHGLGTTVGGVSLVLRLSHADSHVLVMEFLPSPVGTTHVIFSPLIARVSASCIVKANESSSSADLWTLSSEVLHMVN